MRNLVPVGYSELAAGYTRQDLPLSERTRLLRQGWEGASTPSRQDLRGAAVTGAAASLTGLGTAGLLASAGTGVLNRVAASYREAAAERLSKTVFDFVHAQGANPDARQARAIALKELVPSFQGGQYFMAEAGLEGLPAPVAKRVQAQFGPFNMGDARRFVRHVQEGWGEENLAEALAHLRGMAVAPIPNHLALRATPLPTSANPSPAALGDELARALGPELRRQKSWGTRALYRAQQASAQAHATMLSSLVPSWRGAGLKGVLTSPAAALVAAVGAGGAVAGMRRRKNQAEEYALLAQLPDSEIQRHLAASDGRAREDAVRTAAQQLRHEDVVPSLLSSPVQKTIRRGASDASAWPVPEVAGKVLEVTDFIRGVGG